MGAPATDQWPGTPYQPSPPMSMQATPAAPLTQTVNPLANLNPALAPIVQRESGGKQFVGYTPPGRPLVDLSTAPLDDTGFPIWSGNRDPNTGKMSHAAGIGQFQPDTWRPIAQKLGIKDFSLASQVAVANELHREQGMKPWEIWPGATVSAGNWSVSPSALEDEQSKPDTKIVYMGPDEYLQMVPELGDTKGGKSLAKSLNQGDQVENIPTLDVKRDGDQYKVVDQDGRRRAKAAMDAGVDLIPVAIHGAAGEAKQIVGMNGLVKTFDFKPVPVVSKPPAPEQSGFRRYVGESFESLGDAARELPRAVGDIGRGLLGVGERAEIAAETAAGAPAREPTVPLEGLERISDAMTFASGGLLNPIAPELQAAGAATAEAARLPLPAVLPDRGPMGPPPQNMMSPAGQAFIQNLRGVTERENAARDIINARYGQDLAAGGAPATALAQEMAAGAREGQPLTLADVGGENVRALLGSVAREPGAARNRIKQWAVNRLGDIDRDSPIGTSIEDGISKYLATGSARTEARALAEQRAASKPLWDRAMAGGSIAPLRTQLERAYADARTVVSDTERDIRRIDQEVTAAAARQSQAGNVYSTSAANRARQFADDKIAEKRIVLEQAERDASAARDMMKRAQEDATANAPGAIWSPYLGRLLKNPKIAEGIRRGWNIERDIADGENRPFNPREYAVVGEDANGDPLIGAVPNMKLMAVAKEGLDAMLDSSAYKDELTGRLNKAGRALKILRDGMVNEVDQLNPAYKPARDAWAGDSALIANIRDGKNFHKQSPEEIAEHFASASESEKRAYRIGAADTLRDDLGRAVFNGDPSKAIINSPRARRQLLPMFQTPEEATQFLDRVKRARTMFNTPVEVLRSSPTAAREAEDLARRQGIDSALNVIHGITSIPHHPAGVLNSLVRMSRSLVSPVDQALNDTIARMLLDPSIRVGGNPGLELLQKAPLPAVQNMLTRMMQNYGQKFVAPGGLR